MKKEFDEKTHFEKKKTKKKKITKKKKKNPILKKKKKKKKRKEKKKKSEHSYNNGREFFKFGHVEIEKQKFNSSKSVTTISNVDIDKIAMASNNFPCDIKSFK